ncbi:MAG: DUF72 domain-containing protein [Scytolyngbya sp. HA4215-MV1]|jgi:uncharacterized protein YecE (DUF72 family)|nr:DUF72 domain-containing protein [Scytolyngbya sp. HA4215-MV1]
MTFHIGCAVWAYKEWVGDFYPPGSRSGEFLNLYGQRFTTVEGNTTFYSVPDRDTVKRWASEVPTGFKFCPKLPKFVTHQGLLQPSIPAAIKFLELMQGLGEHLGPLFAQLPPGYHPDAWDDLIAFLQAWQETGVPLALEVRHLDWFRAPIADRLNDELRNRGIGRVLLDTRPIYECEDDPQVMSERRKPKLPLRPEATAPFSLVRFISHPNPDANRDYWAEWAERVDEWISQGMEIYFFMHCPDERRSPYHARNFQRLLERQGTIVPSLPWDELDLPPAQLSLF